MAELTVRLDKKTSESLKRHYPGLTLEQAASAALSMAIAIGPAQPNESLKRLSISKSIRARSKKS